MHTKIHTQHCRHSSPISSNLQPMFFFFTPVFCTLGFFFFTVKGPHNEEMRLNSLNRDMFKPFRSHRLLLG